MSFVVATVVNLAYVTCLVQEGRRQEAGGRREASLYSPLFNLFELVGYFRRAVLDSLMTYNP